MRGVSICVHYLTGNGIENSIDYWCFSYYSICLHLDTSGITGNELCKWGLDSIHSPHNSFSNLEGMIQCLRAHCLTGRSLRLTGYHKVTQITQITQVANISGGRAPPKRRTRLIGGTRPPTTSTISGIQCASSDRPNPQLS